MKYEVKFTNQFKKGLKNVTLNQIGYWYMKSKTMYLFSCSIVLVPIQNSSKNDLDNLELTGLFRTRNAS